jgi:hypothetical protein
VSNAIIGTKFKIVSGYPAANVVVKIAMPAGEVDGLLGLHAERHPHPARARICRRQDQDTRAMGDEAGPANP